MLPPTFDLLIRFGICVQMWILTRMRDTFTDESQWAGVLNAREVIINLLVPAVQSLILVLI